MLLSSFCSLLISSVAKHISCFSWTVWNLATSELLAEKTVQGAGRRLCSWAEMSEGTCFYLLMFVREGLSQGTGYSLHFGLCRLKDGVPGAYS